MYIFYTFHGSWNIRLPALVLSLLLSPPESPIMPALFPPAQIFTPQTKETREI
jgi:hypothetical protein